MVSKQSGTNKGKGNANLMVVVRLRPPNEAEDSERYRTVTHAISDHMLVFDPKVQVIPGVVQAKPRSVTSHRFRDLKYAFDHVFGPGATNKDVFEHATKGIVSGVLSGYNCSVFAYGATGAGKTHTMLGSECEPGVIYFTMMDLYRQIEERKKDKIFDVAISYSEVYNEQVRDLLVPRGSLPIREDKTVGVIIAGLSLHKPKTAEELLHMLHFGNKNRTQHPTDANAESSRSHAVFQVFVNQRDKLANVGSEVVMAKMCLVDLAGSERAHCTKNCGARFREGANINRSLLALGNVINALADNKFKGHIPYRDSKLTRLLKDSLGGNCRTVMIAAVSPSSRSFEDTYNTLRYADRAKHIRADLKKNVMSVDFHITNYKKYVQDLEKQNQELRKTKQHLLECLERGENGSNPGLSPIMRQLQERLKDLFKVRRDLCKKQMDCEGAKRELKWKVSRREQAIKRVQNLTQASTVLKKHHGVIERMKKRIEKEEQSLQQSTVQIHDQDKLIRKAVAEFTVTDRRQAPELLDLNVRSYVLESNLHDSEMYLAFVKKLARAQERQASVTESLVTSLLQLVKRQHDVLHSQDLLSPELQHKYEQCCCLVEERGVAFSQPAAASPLHCGDARVSPSYAAALATTKAEVQDHLNISDIIDIRIPRLKAHEVIHCVAEVKPQAPQRVLKSTVGGNTTQETKLSNTTGPNTPSPLYQHSVSPTSTYISAKDRDGSPSTLTACHNPIEQLHSHLDSCPRQRERSNTTYLHSHSSDSRLDGSVDACSPANTQHHPTHHQFPTCAAGRASGTHQRDLPVTVEQQSPVSAEGGSSSTDNFNNTFQVLQPTLPNTPCISGSPQQLSPQRAVPSALPTNTPRGKWMSSSILQHRLSFQEMQRLGKTQLQSQSLLAQGDGRNLDRHQLQQINLTRLNVNNGNSNPAVGNLQNQSVELVSRPSSTTLTLHPASTPYKAAVNPASSSETSSPTNCTPGHGTKASSSSPKSYAEAVKSPSTAHPINKRDELTSMKTPDFSFSQFRRRLQLSCEKLPVRVPVSVVKSGLTSGTRAGENSDSSAARQPLQPLNNNSMQENSSTAGPKPLQSVGISSAGPQNPPKAAKPEASQPKAHTNSSVCTSQGSLRLKAPIQQRFRRALGAAKPYSLQSPRRHRRWRANRANSELAGEAGTTALSDRPSYMQPTFARAQKMLSQDTADTSGPSRRTTLHKQRFVLA